MVWLTWRQHRGEALVVVGVLGLLALFFVRTGLDMANAFQQSGAAACLAQASQQGCGASIIAFLDVFGPLNYPTIWLNILPLLLGMLVGAPLIARELEQGTQRLIWTQGTTRMQWLAVKFVAVMAGSLLAVGTFTALITWWRGPFDRTWGALDPVAFNVEGVAPLAYAAFALALAITAGTLLQRVVPAMVVTVAGFLTVRLPVELLLRPRYLPPITLTWDAFLPSPRPEWATDWIIERGWVNSSGQHLDDRQISQVCQWQGAQPSGGPGAQGDPFIQCVHDHGFLRLLAYQPADRFWLFQGIESTIFLGLAAALLGLAIWWVQRRIA
jgi:ABC-2 family transporter protein